MKRERPSIYLLAGCASLILCANLCNASNKTSKPKVSPVIKGTFAWNLPLIDFAEDKDMRVIVDKVSGQYLGQPDTVLLGDGKTIFVGYPEGHGHPNTILKKSSDGGLTWSDRLPTAANFTEDHFAPTLHRLIGPDGKERLIIIVVTPFLIQSTSDDQGRTWTPFKPIYGPTMKGREGNAGNAPPKSVFRLRDGTYMAMWHQHVREGNMIWKIRTLDGGLSWTEPEEAVSRKDGIEYQPCAPAVIRSPDGGQLLCVLRSYDKSRHSATFMVSDNEGRTWSRLKELPASLMGVRHILRYAPDGRIVAAFRDFNDDSPTHGDCVGWVGAYEDIVNRRPGQYRLRFLDNKSKRATDTGYQGLELLPNGTFVMTTYCALEKDEKPCVVSVRFTMKDIDNKAQLLDAAKQPPRDYTIPIVDLAAERSGQIIVDRIPGQYLGQPDTLLMPDGKTMFAVYPKNHGGRGPEPETFIKKSIDAGLTWSEHLPTPPSFKHKHNSPVIHRLVDTKGRERLIITVSFPVMKQSASEDGGRTWSEFEPLFGTELKGKPGYKGHAPPKSILRLKNGRYLALYHDHWQEKPNQVVEVIQIESDDGGVTWTLPRIVSRHPGYPGAHPCEPAMVRSPDGNQILVLCRENSRKYNSLYMVSNNEGKTWSDLNELPGSLTGDRHIARYAPDGRLVVTFRDRTHISSTKGDFVAWVGRYEDILHGRQGQCRIRLLDNLVREDTGYAGLEFLPDGTFVATTYGHWEKGVQPYVVSVRFKLEEIDSLLKQ